MMNHRAPMLYPVRLGDRDTPIKLLFLDVPPPDYKDNSWLLSAEKDSKNVASLASSQESDSTTYDDAGILGAGAGEQGVRHSRPCKGKRDRYTKLVKHLENQILDNPDSFNLDPARLPPSLQSNGKQREKLMQRIQSFKDRVKRLGQHRCAPMS